MTNKRKKKAISYWKFNRMVLDRQKKVIMSEVKGDTLYIYVIRDGFIYWCETNGNGVYTFRKSLEEAVA